MPMVRLDGEVGWFYTRKEINELHAYMKAAYLSSELQDEVYRLDDPGSYPVKNYKGE